MKSLFQLRTVFWFSPRRTAAAVLAALALTPFWAVGASPATQEMVFIGDDSLSRPVNVFVDGRYSGTLNPREISRVSYCANKEYAVELNVGEVHGEGVAGRMVLGGGRALAQAYRVGLSNAGQVDLKALAEAPALPAVVPGKNGRTVVSRFIAGECPIAVDPTAAVLPAASLGTTQPSNLVMRPAGSASK